MKIKLSHSANEMFLECGQKYKLHHIDKLRSIYIDSPLFFGNALDAAFSHMLLTKKVELTEEEKKQLAETNAYDVFVKKFTTIEHNRETMNVPKSTYVRYSKKDIDLTIMTDEDFIEANTTRNDAMEFVPNFQIDMKDREPEEYQLYNFLCWLSLKRKARMMISAYEYQVLPHIDKVYEIQKSIELPNESGDCITGYIDFIGSFVDEPNVKYIIDNKTSSKAYKADAVLNSPQLATYCEATQINKAAFIVVRKDILKKHPKIQTTILKNEIPIELTEKTFDGYQKSLYAIVDGNFKMKESERECFSFGKPCAYINKCWKNNDKGLIKLGDK